MIKIKRYSGLLVIIIFLGNIVIAQKEASNWYFGGTKDFFNLTLVNPPSAGLKFNDGNVTPLMDGVLGTLEGVATISDKNGNLLFYTDGRTIWNAIHDTLLNGGSLKGHSSSTQSAIIVPLPESNSIYYVFTVDAGAYIDTPNEGVFYSVVDMSLDNGKGAVVEKNNFLVGPASEKLTAVRHCNKKDVWVICHKWESDSFYTYLVTENGISDTIITKIGLMHSDFGNPMNMSGATLGYLKSSTDGSKLACAIYYPVSTVQVFDFDNGTGEISNPIDIVAKTSEDDFYPYGVAFSPNNQILYVTTQRSHLLTPSANLYQYDLTKTIATEINNSRVTIKNYLGPLNAPPHTFGALQLGIDQKIYVAQNNDTALGVINLPNYFGLVCDFVESGVSLNGRRSTAGFPNFIESYFYNLPEIILSEARCVGDKIYFSLDVDSTKWISYMWCYGDGDMSNQFSSQHSYKNVGEHEIKVILMGSCTSDTIVSNITIDEYSGNLHLSDTVICSDEELVIITNTPVFWNTGDTTDTLTLSAEGSYYAMDIDSNGCIFIDSLRITADDCADSFVVPDVFTPNGDGKNDLFYVIPIGKSFDDFDLSIYNRWGQVIFHTKNIEEGWKGNDYNDVRQESGAYYFTVSAKNGSQLYTFAGNLILLR